MIYAEFSYEKINKCDSICKEYKQHEDWFFTSRHTSRHDIAFGSINLNEKIAKRASGNGWKFQVSINHKQLAEAWNIMVDILIEYKVVEAKTLKKESLNKLAQTECGKEITIYCCYEPEKSWKQILTEIETKLHAKGIRRNNREALACKRVKSSRYISYRNDFAPYSDCAIGSSNNYINAENAIRIASAKGTEAYNPLGFQDPFLKLQLDIKRDDIKEDVGDLEDDQLKQMIK